MSASGPQPLSYKWKKDDGEEIFDTKFTGTDTDTLKILSFTEKGRGTYVCVVNGGQQSIKSKPASLELGKLIYFIIVILSSMLALMTLCI